MDVLKLIGLLGGMSWESTAHYYRLMNEGCRARLGGHHSARILLHSVDFHEIERRQHAGDWAGTADVLAQAAEGLAAGGAEFLVIATNTMHKLVDEIEAASGLPVLHIADPTAEAIRAAGLASVGLLGTRFTMEEAFYRDRLADRHGLRVLVPGAPERDAIHRIIYDELCLGRVEDGSRRVFQQAIDGLKARGAQGVILGCTEITMLVGPNDSSLPVFDTTALHATAAVERALSG